MAVPVTVADRSRRSPWARLGRVASGLALVVGLVVACSNGSEDATPTPTTTVAPEPTGPTSTGQVDPGQLATPDTLPDGSFPPVTGTPGAGALAEVRVRLTPVGRADTPTAMVARPGHPDQLFLAERSGRVRLVVRDPDNGELTVAAGAVADLTDEVVTGGEMGLLGLAFAPDGDTLYLSYNVAGNDSRVDAAPVTDRDGRPRVGTRTTLIEVDQPDTTYHKGGHLVVDADGLLYAGFGDGGPQGDADQHAQDTDLLLGKILRIDPTGSAAGRPYRIPAGNPFADGVGGEPEILLVGLRNPWRFSIDPDNGDLWIADVGQHDIEEITRLPGGPASAGANLGWSAYEGTRVFAADRIPGRSVPPVFEISHDDGVCAVTGGVVYRGRAIPDLTGAYLYADLCRPGIDALRTTTPDDGIGEVTEAAALAGTDDAEEVISFATDADGEVYTLSLGGAIHRLDPAR